MPTYAYGCDGCGYRFDLRQSFKDAVLTDCPECSGSLRRIFAAATVVFKGTGFYSTDRSAS